MATERIGKLKPRYSFLLNPYSDIRLSKCPKCERPTHPRKFALFIHVDGWGTLVLGKTCRYCTRDELIIVHQDELEAELAEKFATLEPKVIGNDYLVVGTVDKKVWQRGLSGQGNSVGDVLDHLADFKKVLELEYEPGGWYPADRD
jgi:hypothetical protein